MNELILIIGIVFFVLQIILFFKVWGMTNDVRKILKKISYSDKERMAKIYYLKGNKEKAKELLDEDFFESLLDAKEHKNEAYIDLYAGFENYYSKRYKKMDLEPIDFEKYKDEKLIP